MRPVLDFCVSLVDGSEFRVVKAHDTGDALTEWYKLHASPHGERELVVRIRVCGSWETYRLSGTRRRLHAAQQETDPVSVRDWRFVRREPPVGVLPAGVT